MNNGLILGVDPSLTSTGWAVFDSKKMSCEEWGTIKTTPKEVVVFRFLRIKHNLSKVIEKYNIRYAGCEAPVFGGYETGTAYALYISLLEVLSSKKIDVVFLAPRQIQKIVKLEGYSTAGKVFKSDSVEAAKDFLKDIIPSRATGDKADAFHAARIGSRFWDFFNEQLGEEGLTPTEKEMFTKKHTFVRGKNKGLTEKKGLIYRENDLFFRFSQLSFEE